MDSYGLQLDICCKRLLLAKPPTCKTKKYQGKKNYDTVVTWSNNQQAISWQEKIETTPTPLTAIKHSIHIPENAVAARQHTSEMATNQGKKCLKKNGSIVSYFVLEKPTRRSAIPGHTDCISKDYLNGNSCDTLNMTKHWHE
jgi:hypothetical protein